MIAPVLAAVLPVLATAGLGFLWVRSGRTLETTTLTPLIVGIGTPCLIFSTFAKTSIPAGSFAAVALASISAILCFALVGAAVLRLTRLRVRAFLPTLTFPNNGNLGLPLALYAFGQEGLSYAIVFFAISTVGQFTVGQAIAAGAANWRGMLRMPLIYAVALGAAQSVWGLPLPGWLIQTIALIGGMTIPLMLLMLGASLALLPVETFGLAALLAGLRIGSGVAIGIGIALAFSLDGSARAIVILQSAMPPGIYNYLFAQRWNTQPQEVASVVVLATLASIVSVPALLHFLMQ
jgi:malate permease and related proteins